MHHKFLLMLVCLSLLACGCLPFSEDSISIQIAQSECDAQLASLMALPIVRHEAAITTVFPPADSAISQNEFGNCICARIWHQTEAGEALDTSDNFTDRLEFLLNNEPQGLFVSINDLSLIFRIDPETGEKLERLPSSYDVCVEDQVGLNKGLQVASVSYHYPSGEFDVFEWTFTVR